MGIASAKPVPYVDRTRLLRSVVGSGMHHKKTKRPIRRPPSHHTHPLVGQYQLIMESIDPCTWPLHFVGALFSEAHTFALSHLKRYINHIKILIEERIGEDGEFIKDNDMKMDDVDCDAPMMRSMLATFRENPFLHSPAPHQMCGELINKRRNLNVDTIISNAQKGMASPKEMTKETHEAIKEWVQLALQFCWECIISSPAFELHWSTHVSNEWYRTKEEDLRIPLLLHSSKETRVWKDNILFPVLLSQGRIIVRGVILQY